MSIIEIHARLGTTTLLYTVIMTAWGLWRFFRQQGVDSSFWGALVIAEALFLVQAGLGAYLFFSGVGQLARNVHILYGVVCVLVVPAVFVFTRGNEGRRVMLVYGAGFAFLAAIILRSMATAG